MTVKKLLEMVIEDVFFPIVMGLLLHGLGFRPFMEATFFFIVCDVLTNLWVDYLDFSFRAVRQFTAPVLAPLIGFTAVYWMFPETDLQEGAHLIILYAIYIGYRGAMVILYPIVHLFLFGPVGKFHDMD